MKDIVKISGRTEKINHRELIAAVATHLLAAAAGFIAARGAVTDKLLPFGLSVAAGASAAAGALLPPQAASRDRVISTVSTSAMVFFIFVFLSPKGLFIFYIFLIRP